MSSIAERMKMTTFCCVAGCTHRGQRNKCSFIRIPKALTNRRLDPAVLQLSKDRREKVIQAINRKDWKPTEYHRICSCHYINGKPAKLMDKLNPDWLPTQKLGEVSKKVTRPRKRKIYNGSPSPVPSNNSNNNNINNSKKDNATKRGRSKESSNIETGVHCQTGVKMVDFEDLLKTIQQLRNVIQLQKEDAAKKLEEHKLLVHKKECNAILELAEANYKWKQKIKELETKIKELETKLAEATQRAQEKEKTQQIAVNEEKICEPQYFILNVI